MCLDLVGEASDAESSAALGTSMEAALTDNAKRARRNIAEDFAEAMAMVLQ